MIDYREEFKKQSERMQEVDRKHREQYAATLKEKSDAELIDLIKTLPVSAERTCVYFELKERGGK